MDYDIIFAGGGTTACVTAGRLAAANPKLRILLIEQGPHTRGVQNHTAPVFNRTFLDPSNKVVTFNVSEKSDALAGRSVIVPCVLMYTRAAASDYDDWENVYGNSGWGAKTLLPLLNKAESYYGNGDPNSHGHSGPISVSYGGYFLDSGKSFLEAAAAYDTKRRVTEDAGDFKTVDAYARWAKYINPKTGKRSDAAHHYVYNLEADHNLTIVVDAPVIKILFKDDVAIGVEYKDGLEGVKQVFASQLVVVSGGAFGSPSILQRSGIGATHLLEKLSIQSKVDLPGVGENYQDHNMALAPYFIADDTLTVDIFVHDSEADLRKHFDQWSRSGDGIVATNGIDVAVKLSPTDAELEDIGTNFAQAWETLSENTTDKAALCCGLFDGYVGADTVPRRCYVTPFAFTNYPLSRGRLYITSSNDPTKGVHFEPGYLTHPADLDILRWGYKRMRELVRRMSIYRGELALGHPRFPPESEAACQERSGPVPISAPDIKYTEQDDEAINCFIREKVQTTWHSMGTCAMKPREQGGVVDARLNVYGVQNLKVAAEPESTKAPEIVQDVEENDDNEEAVDEGQPGEGEIQPYKDDNVWRTTSEEKRHVERMVNNDPLETYENIRKAAEVHRQVRQRTQQWIKPGMQLTEIANYIEDGVRALVEEDGLEAGIAFPTGLNLNHCAAHFSPNPGDTTTLSKGDVIKIDFGVHVKGRIVDSAFTMNWEPTYDKLLEAVRASTNTGIKEAGIDARLGEIGGAIQECMESYEVEVGGKVYPVRCIENLSGHQINRYQIHGEKFILPERNDDQTKMEEGEYYAIETFGTTGRGKIVETGDCSHFARKIDAPHVPLRLSSAKSLLKSINKNFGTLAFCRRYLERAGESKHLLALNHLVSQGIVQDYPPLCDQRGSMTAQFEHTIFLRPTVKEVVSRGDDY
ncbi:hypothetical protein ONZ45_g3963 [Pleurotus djamor]|nr:hypothetical protein ONZ45_g3963 [Pleurotus djamor]